jgi:hypothetical protein
MPGQKIHLCQPAQFHTNGYPPLIFGIQNKRISTVIQMAWMQIGGEQVSFLLPTTLKKLPGGVNEINPTSD